MSRCLPEHCNEQIQHHDVSNERVHGEQYRNKPIGGGTQFRFTPTEGGVHGVVSILCTLLRGEVTTAIIRRTAFTWRRKSNTLLLILT